MIKIGLGYNIIITNGISTVGVRIDKKGKDEKASYAKGRIYFNYSPNFYVLTLYLHEKNSDYICFFDGMTSVDSAKPVKTESKIFHVMIKYVFKQEIKRIEFR